MRGLPAEKGAEFEELIAKLFSSRGYEVKRGVWMRGRSGVEHQIDIYAEFKAPLHTSRLIIECKAYDRPVDKDVVMKLIHEVQDLGVDKGILVTTSYFTPDAESVARGYNIELWDLGRVKELLGPLSAPTLEASADEVYTVKPRLGLEELMKLVKGEVVEAYLINYPYYEVEVELLSRIEEGFLRKKVREVVLSSKVPVDAVAGCIVNYSRHDGASMIMPLIASLGLSRDEFEALKVLARSGTLTASALASLLSWSESKARKALQGLASRGLVTSERVERTTRYKLIKANIKYLSPITEHVTLEPGELTGRDALKPLSSYPVRGAITVKQRVSRSDVEESLKSLWNVRVKSFKLIYYPYLLIRLQRRGVEELIALDPVRGKEVEGYTREILAELAFTVKSGT